MKPNVNLIIVLILFIFAGSLIVVGPVHSAWHIETSPTNVILNDVWGASANEVFAVGAEETILHFDGAIWSSKQTSPAGVILRDVWGSSGTNVIAVGDSGKIFRYDGSDWKQEASGTTVNLHGIWVTSGGLAFAVGDVDTNIPYEAVILYYNGTSWVTMVSGLSIPLKAVWGISPDNVFAVGDSGTILRYDGNSWSPMNSYTTTWLSCVWGSSDKDVFAAGSSTAVYRYDGNADNDWTETFGSVEYPDDLWGSSDRDVYAVGGSDFNKIDHFDGNTWSTWFLTGNHPNGVWGSAKDNVFVVGNGGMIMRDFINKPPFPPPIDGPVDEASFGELDTIVLDGGTYSDPENHLHDLTYFQVRRADSRELRLDEIFSAGVTDYPISPGTILPGLKYNWRVGYVDALGAVGWSEWYSFKIGTPEDTILPKIVAGTDVSDFGMISIVHWPENMSPEAVFNIEYDRRNYLIGTYDAVNNRYIEFDNGLEMEPGRSYWILAREGLTIDFSGIPVILADDVYVALNYNASTGNGWNMVAPPNDAEYYWANVKVVEEIDGVLIDRETVQNLADDNLYIDRQLWRWENGHYHSDTPDTDPNLAMEAYAGYWVKARQANVFLRFEPGARVASLGKPEILMAGIWKKTKTWLSNLNIFSKEAVAGDDNTPPMPMGTLDDNTADPVFQGCFIEITNDCN